METIRPQPPHSLNNKTALFFQKFYSFRKNVHCNKETSNKEKLLKRDHRRCNHLRCIRRGKILGATKEWNLSEIEVFFQLFFRIIDYFWEKFDFCFIIKFSSDGAGGREGGGEACPESLECYQLEELLISSLICCSSSCLAILILSCGEL